MPRTGWALLLTLLFTLWTISLSQYFDPFDPFACLSVLCKKKNISKTSEHNLKVKGLTHVELHFRQLRKIPTKILEDNKDTIEILDLSSNIIERIETGDFPHMFRLHTLLLDYNHLEFIENGALDNLTELQTLSLINNRLTEVPYFFRTTALKKIDISWNLVSEISTRVMEKHRYIEEMYLQRNQLTSIKDDTFIDNWNLKTLETSYLQGRRFQTFQLQSSAPPPRNLPGSYHNILLMSREKKELSVYSKDLSQNPLKTMEPKSLLGPRHLYKLNLRKTNLEKIPDSGLGQLKHLDIRDIKTLWAIPEARLFRSLEEIKVTYSVHCCAFQRLEKQHFLFHGKFTGCKEYLLYSTISPGQPTHELKYTTPSPTPKVILSTLKAPSKSESSSTKIKPVADPWGSFLGGDSEDPFRGLMDSYRSNSTDPPLCHENSSNRLLTQYRRHIVCSPSPDAFNPCDDVMGSTMLRICCWVIALLAVVGNTLQTIVLYTNSQSMTVYKCFMYHLAIANLVMGVYLLILCSLDAYTYGKYYNYVQSWQYAGGCKVAGFLAIFSSELSICLLAFITLERYLLIVHALNVSHQMRLIHARIVLAFIYTYALTIASLPLSNAVSSYSKVAICLPFETGSTLSSGYVLWLLAFNALIFVYVSVSYLHMYHKVKKSNRGMGINNDIEVAKRMALIVFSNFACWVPISVSGFITMFTNLPLNIETSKFLLVFIFPINACTNPFLYAFFTKIFKEDVLFLMSKMGIFRERTQRAEHGRVPYHRTRSGTRSCECTNNSEISYRASENGKSVTTEQKTSISSNTYQDSAKRKNTKKERKKSNEKEMEIKTFNNELLFSSPRLGKKENEDDIHLTDVICHRNGKSPMTPDEKCTQEQVDVPSVSFRFSKDDWRLSEISDGFCTDGDDMEMSRFRSVSLAIALTSNQSTINTDSIDIISPTTQISSLEVD